MNKKNIYLCPVCSDACNDFVKHYTCHSKVLDGYEIRSCTNCNHCFIYPNIKEKIWDEYNKSYFSSAHGGINQSSINIAYNTAISKIRFDYLKQIIALHKLNIKKVLEIGPGEGYFAKEFMINYSTVEYYAYESDTSLHNKLIENNINLLTNLNEGIHEDRFDLIIISHVLEHTLYPVKWLQDMTKNLRPLGMLFVEVPCQDHKYKSMSEPHVMFFSKDSLKITAQKTGFESINITFHGDKIKNIIRFELLKRIITKVLYKTKLFPLFKNFLNKSSIVQKYNFSSLESLSVFTTRPYVKNETESRWLRLTAIKGKQS
jgi:2-polyprenyl-3-methyl-5-hydroxy-6-metoxy-1,4-benzoquinol methylase